MNAKKAKAVEEENLDIDFSDAVDQEEFDADDGGGAEDMNEVMNRNHPKWTEYVLSLIPDDELLFDENSALGMPKAETFRWLVERLIGDIIDTKLDVSYHANPVNGEGNAVVVVHCTVFDNELEQPRTYAAAADANGRSTGSSFASYLVATAETRAKGRLYRDILRLKNIIASEEVNPEEQSKKKKQVEQSQEGMNAGQKIIIERFVSGNGVDMAKFIEKTLEKSKELSELTKDDGVKLCKAATTYKVDTSKIPDDIKVKGK